MFCFRNIFNLFSFHKFSLCFYKVKKLEEKTKKNEQNIQIYMLKKKKRIEEAERE